MLSVKHYFVISLSISTLLADSSEFPREQLRSTQSSTCSNLESSLAYDGQRSTFACALNNPISGLEGAWWEGDLSSQKKITGIKVTAANQNYYFTLLEKFNVYVCNEALAKSHSISNCMLCAEGPKKPLRKGKSININCTSQTVGQYVLLFKPFFGEFTLPARQFALAEIQIFIQ